MARKSLLESRSKLSGPASENMEKEEKPKIEAPKLHVPQTGLRPLMDPIGSEKREIPFSDQMLRISRGSTMKDLESLMASFLSELELERSLCNKTPGKAEDKKLQIKQRLIFFNSAYREIPEPKRIIEYLSKMSDLLVHYVALEVLTSADPFTPDSEDGKDLISRIITTVYTSLDSSEDYVLDTMMKIGVSFEKDNTKKEISVYSELFKIVVKKARKRQVDDLTYMRYVLVYRLWKMIIKEDDKMKEKVIKMAAKRLKPPPKFVKRRSALPQVLPQPTKKTANVTEFFMREKYNVRKMVKKFLEEASEATHQTNMFINLSCDPRLLNPKIRDPLPTPDSRIQEFSTFESMADDVWQRLHEEPHSRSSIFEQVTTLKKTPTCTPNRMFNLLHSHHLQHKARLAEKKKAASRKACFRGRPLVGGIISSHRMNGHQEAYSPSVSKSSHPVGRDPAVRRPQKRRALDTPDVVANKASYVDDPKHIYVETSGIQKGIDHCKPWLSPSKPREGNCEAKSNQNDKMPDLGCSSSSSTPAAVKSVVKEEPGSSCESSRSFGGPDSPGKLAIEKVVEKTLEMLQKSKPVFETSPVKTEVESTSVVDTANLPVPPVPDWNPDGNTWLAPGTAPIGMGHWGQPQDYIDGEDVWMDELLSFLPS